MEDFRIEFRDITVDFEFDDCAIIEFDDKPTSLYRMSAHIGNEYFEGEELFDKLPSRDIETIREFLEYHKDMATVSGSPKIININLKETFCNHEMVLELHRVDLSGSEQVQKECADLCRRINGLEANISKLESYQKNYYLHYENGEIFTDCDGIEDNLLTFFKENIVEYIPKSALNDDMRKDIESAPTFREFHLAVEGLDYENRDLYGIQASLMAFALRGLNYRVAMTPKTPSYASITAPLQLYNTKAISYIVTFRLVQQRWKVVNIDSVARLLKYIDHYGNDAECLDGNSKYIFYY